MDSMWEWSFADEKKNIVQRKWAETDFIEWDKTHTGYLLTTGS
jgi:hypothetical protein